MKPNTPIDEETWLEFLGPSGVESYCICPNDRAIKQLGGGELLPPEGDPS